MSEFKYVPVKATEEMTIAAPQVGYPLTHQNILRIWKAMIAASPSPAESDKEAVRNAALEQAAIACTNTQLMNIDSYCGGTALMCADHIRDLKSTSVSEVSQPAQPSDTEPSNTGHGHVFPRPDGVRARCGGPGICSECSNDASRKAGMQTQPSDSRTEFSDTELLNWVTENRAIVDYYGNGYRVCFIDDGSFYPEVYPTIEESIKAAMQADREGS